MAVLMPSFLNLGASQHLLTYRKSVINRKSPLLLGTQFIGDTQKGLVSHSSIWPNKSNDWSSDRIKADLVLKNFY